MRQSLAILLSILLLVPAAPAQATHDWNQVEKLKLDDPVLVLLWTGEKLHGHLINALDDELQLGAYIPYEYGVTYFREINRADIHRIELVRSDQHLPNPKKWAIGGAIIGGAAGVGLGIHRDNSEPTACQHACWLLDGASLAGLGAITGLFTSAFVTIGHLFRRNKLIYEDTAAHTPHIH